MNKYILSPFIVLLYSKLTLSQRCGLSDDSTRIVGGQTSRPLAWPWMALLTITIVSNGRVVKARCGGSLISEEWVMTAAHCVNPRPGAQQYVDIVLGDNDITRPEGTEVKRYATHVSTHSNIIFNKHLFHSKVVLNGFNPSLISNDIALLKLNQRLDFKGEHNYLQPICLPTNGLKTGGDNCFATGWGSTTSGGRSSSTLQQVRLPVQNDNYCRRLYRNEFNREKQICVGYLPGGKDSCQGDSGGPLNCQLPNGVWIQEGITSFGNGCANPMTPGVYTKVAAYVPWIQRVTGI